MRSNTRSDTSSEKRLRSELHRLGLRFRKDFAVRVGGGRPIRVDVVFPRVKVAVFVDGCFWHRCPEHGTSPKANASYWLPKLAANVERDRRVDRQLRRAGWDVIRVWEHESAAEAASRIARALVSVRSGGSADWVGGS
jgi:DNA mismatch endonuclease (patch repair protein)